MTKPTIEEQIKYIMQQRDSYAKFPSATPGYEMCDAVLTTLRAFADERVVRIPYMWEPVYSERLRVATIEECQAKIAAWDAEREKE